MPEAYASGNWHVTKGKEEAFVETWTELLEWTRKTQPGLVRATLMRHEGQPQHFVSFAEWEDGPSRDTWKARLSSPICTPSAFRCATSSPAGTSIHSSRSDRLATGFGIITALVRTSHFGLSA